MERIQCNIVVDATPEVCYQKWHHFEQFPHFMNNVEEVNRIDDKSWHWVVNGPLGHRTEWDAVIDRDEPGRMISWHSGAKSELEISGLVNFLELGRGQTQITCEMAYDPPGGVIGEAVAHLFANPEKMVQEDLNNFKHLVEGTNIPAEKVHTGRTMHPNDFVMGQSDSVENTGNVPYVGSQKPGSATAGNVVSQGPVLSDHAYRSVETGLDVPADNSLLNESGIEDDEGYELIYGLEDDIPPIGTSANLPSGDIREIEMINEEESPYLGLSEGAVYSEDLIDMRNDSPFDTRDTDIYAESMDVDEEDLASFTENIDSDIDIGLGSRESLNPFDSNAPDMGLGPREVSQSAEDRQMNSGLPSDK